MESKRVHSEFGPSNYPAWNECPFYESDGESRRDSAEGTKIHEQAQELIDHGTEPENATARWFGETIIDMASSSREGVTTEAKFEAELPEFGGLRVWGFVDAYWFDDNDILHIADFKSFSDGTKDHVPQLMGYAYIHGVRYGYDLDTKVILHILHGMARKVETVEVTFYDCCRRVEYILRQRMKARDGKINARNVCSACQFCKNVSSCTATANAVQVVHDNSVSFRRLNICQKLVVLDAVDKLSKSLREEAKRLAELNGGAIEMDGIRYEMRPWGGTSVCRDICTVASDLKKPVAYREHKGKIGYEEVKFNGLTNSELIALCSLPKSKLLTALKEKNKGGDVKVGELQKWVDDHYEKKDGSPHFVRTK